MDMFISVTSYVNLLGYYSLKLRKAKATLKQPKIKYLSIYLNKRSYGLVVIILGS